MTKNKFAGLAEAKMRALETDDSQKEQSKKTSQEEAEKKKTVKQVGKGTGKLASNKSIKLAQKKNDEPESLVGVTIKIPENKRIWWNVQAKLQRTTVTDAIIEALDKRFGEPQF